MNDFWVNISRYPRFFISSVLGSLLIIITPLKNLVRTPTTKILLICFILLIVTSLYFIIKSMIGL